MYRQDVSTDPYDYTYYTTTHRSFPDLTVLIFCSIGGVVGSVVGGVVGGVAGVRVRWGTICGITIRLA
jgi:hypothetical protein